MKETAMTLRVPVDMLAAMTQRAGGSRKRAPWIRALLARELGIDDGLHGPTPEPERQLRLVTSDETAPPAPETGERQEGQPGLGERIKESGARLRAATQNLDRMLVARMRETAGKPMGKRASKLAGNGVTPEQNAARMREYRKRLKKDKGKHK